MKKWLALGLSLVISLLTATLHAAPLGLAQPESVSLSAKQLGKIDKLIETAIHDKQTPGAVVLVARQGKIVYRKAYGNKTIEPALEPMKVDTIFDVASLTKVLATAPAMMLLVEDGRCSLSDRVSQYIPEFAKQGKDQITIKQLLTHYSGLPPSLDLTEPWSGYQTAIDMANNTKLANPPGEKFVYSDINYIIAAELVRRLSGQPINEFVQTQLFAPLGLSNTTFLPDITWQPRIAPTEKRDGNWLRGKVHDPTTDRMGGVSGQAGLFSTVDDVAVFAQMILDQGKSNGIQIMHASTVKAMTANQAPLGKADKRGIGFDISSPYSTVRGDLLSENSFGHSGFTGTSLWIDPTTQTIIILLTNRVHPDGKGDVIALRKRLANIVGSSIST